jgi:MATE family multidrug resistance protein
MSTSYQLTKYPIGSMREVWAIAWPLMIGLISTSLMIFIDRMLLAWYAPAALNAGANAGMAYYMFLIIPMGICAISEVIAGRLHGKRELYDIGSAVWQMVWFAVMATPFLWLAGWLMGPVIFYGTGNEEYEMAYFQPLMFAAPFACIAVALSGFFIGTGKVRLVTYSILIANILNMVIAYVLIFGIAPFPPMGVRGAGIAMGLAELFQMLLLLAFFLRSDHRQRYGTGRYHYQPTYFWEGLHIGAPASLGHGIEVLAHYIFMRIVMSAGSEQLTIVALIQSFYILIGFVIEAQSKAVSAIAANLIGAKRYDLIGKVFQSATKLHTLFFALLAVVWLSYPDKLLSIFLSGESAHALADPALMAIAHQAALWMGIFFLFDGLSWILIGLLTAAGDTKFIFYISSLVNWVAYVLPTFFLVGIAKGGADIAWLTIAVYSVINFSLYFWRYYSGEWLTRSINNTTTQPQPA